MVADVVRDSVYAAALLAVTGVVAVASGSPFLFPSLGPSAYVLATVRDGERVAPQRVVGGHAIGVGAGLVAHHTLASGLVVTGDLAALSPAATLLAASAVVSVGLTTAGMLATDLVHPPACATTLIVALGLLPTIRDGGIILLAVGCLVAAHAGLQTLDGHLTTPTAILR
jgi:hypothetical protein